MATSLTYCIKGEKNLCVLKSRNKNTVILPSRCTFCYFFCVKLMSSSCYSEEWVGMAQRGVSHVWFPTCET
jgi:hypothetical protein